MTYLSDRGYSDAFIPALRNIVGPLLLDESSLEQDRHEAADLVVFTAKSLTIACRVRRPGYADAYPWDFTIRAERLSGARTELSKIIDGWGDWMVYGHDSGVGASLSRWFVIDLAVFRAQLIRSTPFRKRISSQATKNRDGKTAFFSFDVRDAPRSLVIASSEKLEAEAA